MPLTVPCIPACLWCLIRISAEVSATLIELRLIIATADSRVSNEMCIIINTYNNGKLKTKTFIASDQQFC